MISFRNATRDDFNEVKAMYDNMQYIGEDELDTDFRKPLEKARYEEYLESESVILLEREGEIIGFAFCFAFKYEEGSHCNLTEMFIKPEWRGYGYCRQFIEHIKGEATKININKIIVWSENKTTDILLPRIGFKSVNFSDEYECLLQ